MTVKIRKYTKEQLVQAIRDANDWVMACEGIPITDYADDWPVEKKTTQEANAFSSYGESRKILRDVIEPSNH